MDHRLPGPATPTVIPPTVTPPTVTPPTSVDQDRALDTVYGELDRLGDKTLDEHVEVFSRIHQQLTSALAATGNQPGPAPQAPTGQPHRPGQPYRPGPPHRPGQPFGAQGR